MKLHHRFGHLSDRGLCDEKMEVDHVPLDIDSFSAAWHGQSHRSALMIRPCQLCVLMVCLITNNS